MTMSVGQLELATVSDIPITIRNAGIVGAGGAGFPSHAKWEHINTVKYLLVNHQESEPNYFVDKMIGREYAEELGALFDSLLDRVLDVVVISAKEKDREQWMGELEATTDGTVYLPEELPIDPDDESGVVFAYTDDVYQYGMESVLLQKVADTVIGSSLPMDYDWIVQNTETMLNIYRSLMDGSPVTEKYLHVDGNVPRHRFLKVPIGTPAMSLLEAAGLPLEELPEDALLADGGPGWCFEIYEPPEEFGVRKQTNCLLVLDEQTAREHTLGQDRINVLDLFENRSRSLETQPTRSIQPPFVRIPLISNPSFEGVVQPSVPIVAPGERVKAGEMIATPNRNGISVPQHASINGEVNEVTDTHIVIDHIEDAPVGRRKRNTTEGTIYWTWCMGCGTYVIPPIGTTDPNTYVCRDCR